MPKELYADPDYYYPYLEERFGAHPPEFGYKDIIKRFRATKALPKERPHVTRKRTSLEIEGLDQDRIAAPEPSIAAQRLWDSFPYLWAKWDATTRQVFMMCLEHGETQREAAERLGLSQQRIGQIIQKHFTDKLVQYLKHGNLKH